MASRKRHSSCPDEPANPKKIKYACKFQEKWKIEFDCITNSDKGESYVYCTVCNSHFGITYGGKNDVQRHVTSTSHKQNSVGVDKSKKLTDIFLKKTTTLDENVRKLKLKCYLHISLQNIMCRF